MFNTIIADLDNKNIAGIKSYIENNFKIFHINNTFNNEKEFFKYIREKEEVNLIIVEVKFLGIELFKKIKEISSENKHIKFIFYGAIDDIDYLKKTLDMGAISYAIRPVKSIDLKRCLTSYLDYTRARETLKKEKKMLDMEYLQNFKLFEDKFLKVLVNEKILKNEEIEDSFKYFDINISSPYTVAVFRIDNFREYIGNKTQKEKHIIIFKIMKIINNNINNGRSFINLFNEAVVILGGKYETNEIFELLKEIKMQIKEEIDLGVSCGVGRTYEEPTNINTSFLEAITALRYRCIIGNNAVILIDYVEAENIFTSKYPYEKEKSLVYAAVIGEYEYCTILLDSIFIQINNYKDKFENILPQIIMSILISINRNAFEQGLEIEPIANFFKPTEVLNLKTVEEAHKFLQKGLKEFCSYITEFRKNIENNILEEMINYIKENYTKEISYKILGKEFNTNPTYLKRIFETETQKNIENYIAKIRIEKAKELILETNLTDDLIALKIGYDDVNIFRQTFKRIEGCLAGDFRYIKKEIRR